MKVAFCLNHFMPYQVAGTEVYVWALAKSLQQKGHFVSIVIPNYNKDIGDKYEYDGLKVYRYAEPDTVDRALITGKREPAGINSFEKLIQELQPELVHIHELAGANGIGIFHLRSLKRLRMKVVFTMHLARYSCFSSTLKFKGRAACNGVIDIKKCTSCALSKVPINTVTHGILYNTSIFLYSLGVNTGKINSSLGTAFSYPFIIQSLRKTLHEIFELCDKVIILTDWYKKVLLDNGVCWDKIHIIKQGLPYTAEFKKTEIRNTNSTLKLVFIGRVDPLKGIHLLLEALQNLNGEKISLDIYGVVNDEAYYSYWKECTVGFTNIKWLSPLPQQEIVKVIAQYDALVLPSVFSEMSPLVIQEAFAAGVPVIGAEVAGIAEQVKDRTNGLLFKFNDSYSLQKLLDEIIESPDVIYSLRNKMQGPMEFETVVENTLGVYREALSVAI